jgi:hypothetical protein
MYAIAELCVNVNLCAIWGQLFYLMMEAAGTSEILVLFYQTTCHIPQVSNAQYIIYSSYHLPHLLLVAGW